MRDQESRARRREEVQRERLERMESMVVSQNDKLDKLEDLVYRVMHRNRISTPGSEQEGGEGEQRNVDGLENGGDHPSLRHVNRGSQLKVQTEITSPAKEMESTSTSISTHQRPISGVFSPFYSTPTT